MFALDWFMTLKKLAKEKSVIAEIPLAIFGSLAKFQSMNAASKTFKRKKPTDFRKAADVFKALGNPNRLLIVDALGRGEKCVADLTELVGLDMSTVSNHLSVLRNVGLLVDERRGTQIFYTLKNPCVLKICGCLDEFHANAGA
jgi:ArsR family transcriptional regulator